MKNVIGVVVVFTFSLLMSPVSAKEVSDLEAINDTGKVTREANGWLTSYGDWVYYWGRNVSEKETKITNAFFREKFDGNGKMMLSDWDEKVYSPEFDIENEAIYYLGYEYQGDRWRYFLKKMDLDGKNKTIVLDPIQFGGFEVEGNLVYSFGYDTKGCASVSDDERNNGIVYRTNLETKKSVVLKKCIYPRLGPITANGIYLDDEFYPNNSQKPQPSKLKNVWKQIGHKSPMFLEINKDSVFPDRGDIYYLIWSRQASTQYLVKHNEKSGKTTLVRELPKYDFPYLRMVNVYRGYAYFEVSPLDYQKLRDLYRIPLSGGELEKVMDIPSKTSYSIINGKIYFYGENLKILARVPLPL